MPRCSLSTKLSTQDLEAINTLENELGSPILAFSCREDLGFADVNTEQLAKIQALENKLGLSLVAVRR